MTAKKKTPVKPQPAPPQPGVVVKRNGVDVRPNAPKVLALDVVAYDAAIRGAIEKGRREAQAGIRKERAQWRKIQRRAAILLDDYTSARIDDKSLAREALDHYARLCSDILHVAIQPDRTLDG